jgi:hypothetical protein
MRELGLPEVYNSGKGAVDDAANGARSNTALNDAMKAKVNEAKYAAAAQVNVADFEGIGMAMMAGIAKGINDNKGEVTKSTYNVADESVYVAKQALEIRSPSKKFEAIGRNQMLGYAAGIEKNGVSVLKAQAKVISGLSTSMAAPKYDPIEMTSIRKIELSGAKNSSDPINYDRLGSALANALVGMGISVDGRQFGRVMRNLA